MSSTRCVALLIALTFTYVGGSERGFAQEVAVGSGAAGNATAIVRQLTGRLATDALRIDGRLDDTAWDGVPFADGFVQQRPNAGRPASMRTEARVVRDDDAIYVGARMYDSAPDSIVAQLARRDATVSSDWFWVYFDTYRDRRSAFGFGVNAAGVQRDVRVADDTREDANWDAVWSAAVQRDSAGWTVELRIPLSQLRYVAGTDAPVWGINFRREIARTDEVGTWALSPQGSGRFVSDFGTLALPGPLPLKRDIDVQPYVLSSAEHVPGEAGDPWRGALTAAWSAGADLTMGLGKGLTFAATVNPDFGQVDADPSQLNLSAFETFLGERRPFFVEGADIFQLAFPAFPKLFHSRRIGRAPQGNTPGDAKYEEPAGNARILGAAKVTGQTESGWTVGLLHALTGEEQTAFERGDASRGMAAVEPAAHYSVVRVARAFNDDRTTAGALVTSTIRDIETAPLRSLHDGAWTGGIDASHRFADGTVELAGSVVGSHVRGDTLALQRTQRAAGRRFHRPDAAHVSYDPDATSLTGAGVSVRLRTLGDSPWRFTAESWARSPGLELGDLGFQFADGADSWGGYGRVTFRQLEPAGIFRRWSLSVNGYAGATFGGELSEQFGSVTLDAQFENLWTLFADVGGNLATLSPEALRGGPALRRDGGTGMYVELGSDPRKTVVLNVSGNANRENGTGALGYFAEPAISIRPSARATVRLSASHYRATRPAQYVGSVTTPDGPVYVVGGLDQRIVSGSLRLDYTFTPTLSLQLWAQPFLAAGRYDAFREVVRARADTFDDRYVTLAPGQIARDDEAGAIRVDRDRDGTVDYSFGAPDFSVRELHSNLVLRWEYRPGSTAFLVWGHDRSAGAGGADFRMGREIRQLLATPAANRVMLKLSYRLGS